MSVLLLHRRAALLVLAFTSAVAALGQDERTRLSQLYQQADHSLDAYDLDAAERSLDQARDLAAKLSPADELAALVRLTNAYLDLQKRDGQYWRNLVIPQLRHALDISANAAGETANHLAVKMTLAVIQLPTHGYTAELAPKMAQLLGRWIDQLEARYGPLNPATADAYEALAFAPRESEAQLRALHACDILLELNTAPPQFAPLLIHCATHELRLMAKDSTLRFTAFLRAIATAGGPRFAFENVESYLVEAELQKAYGNMAEALAAFDAAQALAEKYLSPSHPIFERIENSRDQVLRWNAPAATGPKELVRRQPKHVGHPRIGPPKLLALVQPEYTPKAKSAGYQGITSIAVSITTEGNGKIINTFSSLPYGLSANVEKAVLSWKFQPWTLDGKPVPGVAMIDVLLAPKNKTTVTGLEQIQ